MTLEEAKKKREERLPDVQGKHFSKDLQHIIDDIIMEEGATGGYGLFVVGKYPGAGSIPVSMPLADWMSANNLYP